MLHLFHVFIRLSELELDLLLHFVTLAHPLVNLPLIHMIVFVVQINFCDIRVRACPV